eukprot:GAHX01000461.1.p1 GENE.GAHX01000461.1~~GAHX01000461.1.p1  ORF type:complete len:475 (-),score=91.15 GAHX01000461.1:106-1530(-)
MFITGTNGSFFANEIFPITGWEDLSLHPATAELIGITEKEILSYYTDDYFEYIYAKMLKRKVNDITYNNIEEVKKKVIEQLKTMYGGFRFTNKELYVFNFISILNCFRHLSIDIYWKKGGRTTYYWNLVLSCSEDLKEFFKTGKVSNVNKEVLLGSPGFLNGEYNIGITTAYQTGILSIKSYNKTTDTFDLEIPNYEIKQLFRMMAQQTMKETAEKLGKENRELLRSSLKSDNWALFFKLLSDTISKVSNLCCREELNEHWFTTQIVAFLKGADITEYYDQHIVCFEEKTYLEFQFKYKIYIVQSKITDEGCKRIKRGEGCRSITNSLYPKTKSTRYMSIPNYIIGVNFQMFPDTQSISLEQIKNRIMNCISDKEKENLTLNDNREYLVNKLNMCLPTANNIDSFYMKKIEYSKKEKYISHLEGKMKTNGEFELSIEDSCKGNMINSVFAGYKEKPFGLIWQRSGNGVKMETKD